VSQLEKERRVLSEQLRQLKDKSARLEADNGRLKQLTTKQESLLTEVRERPSRGGWCCRQTTQQKG
jgi:hypothetical protein